MPLVVFPLLKASRKSPEATATEIGEYLVANTPEIKAFNVIKGFLNLSLDSAFWAARFREVAANDTFGQAAPTGRTVMIEYSSPNTNKPLHLGHIRNNLLGYSVAQILKANGNKVIKVNLVNDRGIHICKSMLAWKLYGGGETVSFSVDPREIKPLIYTPNSYIVEFDIEGKKEQAVLREAQFHPVREEILHLDFYRIAEGKPGSIAIPVRLTGNAEGVKVGGKLALSARKLVVSALVENLPDEIVVDVTELGVGKTIFVGDLEFENLKFITPATTAVCAVRVTRASRGAAEAAK